MLRRHIVPSAGHPKLSPPDSYVRHLPTSRSTSSLRRLRRHPCLSPMLALPRSSSVAFPECCCEVLVHCRRQANRSYRMGDQTRQLRPTLVRRFCRADVLPMVLSRSGLVVPQPVTAYYANYAGLRSPPKTSVALDVLAGEPHLYIPLPPQKIISI